MGQGVDGEWGGRSARDGKLLSPLRTADPGIERGQRIVETPQFSPSFLVWVDGLHPPEIDPFCRNMAILAHSFLWFCTGFAQMCWGVFFFCLRTLADRVRSKIVVRPKLRSNF